MEPTLKSATATQDHTASPVEPVEKASPTASAIVELSELHLAYVGGGGGIPSYDH